MDLYKLILQLLSLIFSLLLQIKLAVVRLWNVKKQLRSYAIHLINYLWPRSVLTRPSNIPVHLALLINEPQVNLNNICKLLVLACKYGIGQVSIYEPHGFFGNVDSLARLNKILRRKSRSRFKFMLLLRPSVVGDWASPDDQRSGDIKEVDNVIKTKNDVIDRGNDVIIRNLPEVDVILKDDVIIGSDVIVDQNHFLQSTLRVYLLGANAGRWTIAQAAQASVNCVSLQGAKFEFSSFLDILTQFSSPEADLALVFGKVPSMMGYPPLALKLTELLFLPTHHSVTEANFVDWLETFSKRDRRRGK